jgi:hypothetical protein
MRNSSQELPVAHVTWVAGTNPFLNVQVSLQLHVLSHYGLIPHLENAATS